MPAAMIKLGMSALPQSISYVAQPGVNKALTPAFFRSVPKIYAKTVTAPATQGIGHFPDYRVLTNAYTCKCGLHKFVAINGLGRGLPLAKPAVRDVEFGR